MSCPAVCWVGTEALPDGLNWLETATTVPAVVGVWPNWTSMKPGTVPFVAVADEVKGTPALMAESETTPAAAVALTPRPGLELICAAKRVARSLRLVSVPSATYEIDCV